MVHSLGCVARDSVSLRVKFAISLRGKDSTIVHISTMVGGGLKVQACNLLVSAICLTFADHSPIDRVCNIGSLVIRSFQLPLP